MPAAESPPILAGLRVIELSAFVAAPSCGLALAQLGADVIRIDPPGGNIDIGRLPLAPPAGPGAEPRSIYWASLNRGKRSVEIDLRSPEGQRLVTALVTGSGPDGGIVLTNLSLSGALGYAALAKERPDLIYVQLSGSPDGRNALDYTVNCAIGIPMVTGDGTHPVNHVLPAWDLVSGQMLALAVLAAERRRRETGAGQHVKLTLADVGLASVMNLAYTGEVELTGNERQADDNFLYGAYGDVFRTRDGRWAMALAISDKQWQVLLDAVGLRAPLAAAADALGHSLADENGRWQARELISAFFRPWFAKRTLAEVATALADRTILWGPYRTFSQLIAEDPRFSEANPMFRRVHHPEVGTFLTAASPIEFGAAERVPPASGPILGSHTRAVLGELAGVSPAELDRLAAAKVIR